jgi:hypothetical protein
MRRLPDWEQRLLRWAERELGVPFIWGVTDCHALAVRAFACMYGYLPPVPTWTTKSQALRFLASRWQPTEALPRLGAFAVQPGYCQRGDIVVEPPKDTQLSGVLVALGQGVFLTSQPDKVVGYADRLAVDAMATVWRWPDHG